MHKNTHKIFTFHGTANKYYSFDHGFCYSCNFAYDLVGKKREFTIEKSILFSLWKVSMDIHCHFTKLQPRNLASHDHETPKSDFPFPC